jgi:hypothetical protein
VAQWSSRPPTDDPGFESRQGVTFLGIYTSQCCCQNLIYNIHIYIYIYIYLQPVKPGANPTIASYSNASAVKFTNTRVV